MSIIEKVKFLGDVEVAGSLKKDGKEILTGADLSAPDWNQNDPAASDYVKNRTHYDASIIRQEFKASDLNGKETIHVGSDYDKICEFNLTLVTEKLPVDNKLYVYNIETNEEFNENNHSSQFFKKKVSDDYECIFTLSSFEVDDGNNSWISGFFVDNIIIFTKKSCQINLSVEDEYFSWNVGNIVDISKAGIWVYNLQGYAVDVVEEIKQLDEKYIPSSIARSNQYESVGQNSFATGLNTLAGSKAFTIQSMYANEGNKIVFELDDVTGLEEKQKFSVFLYKDDTHSEQYENFGTITYIKDKTVGTDKSPEDFKFVGITQPDSYIGKDGYDTEANSFRIIDRPDLGTRTIGANTFAAGVNTKVLSKNSAGFGDGNLSYGSHSFVAGKNNQVGFAATAFGRNNHSSGDVTTSFGQQNAANGYASLATGANTTASGIASSSFGNLTKASGNKSSAFGGETTASGENSVATGNKTTASGKDSVSIGRETIASGEDSLAVGKLSQATGLRSIAGGFKTESTGGNAVSFGNMTKATGTHSIAIGDQTIAEGEASFAEGRQTIAKRRSQHVYGEFNIADSEGTANYNRGKYVHIVGNGTADNKRSNAHTLDWNGNAWFAGSIVSDVGISAPELTINGTTVNVLPSIVVYKVNGLQYVNVEGYYRFNTKVPIDNQSQSMVFVDLDPSLSSEDDYKIYSTLIKPHFEENKLFLDFPESSGEEKIQAIKKLKLTVAIIRASEVISI